MSFMVTGHVLFKHTQYHTHTTQHNTQTCLQHTKASDHPLHPPSQNTLQCASLQTISPGSGHSSLDPCTENSLFVNWGFVLCLTELTFRSLCLISETKGNHSPARKKMKPLTVLGFCFVDISIERALFKCPEEMRG